MESPFADLVDNEKAPKRLRCSVVSGSCGFVIFPGIALLLKSPLLFGKIFCGTLNTVRPLCLGGGISVYQNRKQHK